MKKNKLAEKATFTFSCTRCGECCREAGFVFFTEKEIHRAATYLGMEISAFKRHYLIRMSEGYAVSVSGTTPCVFLTSEGCTINDVKPDQCESFPYWQEYVGKNGELVNFDRPCPGIKKK